MTLNLFVTIKGKYRPSDVTSELSRYGKVRDFGRFDGYHAMSVTGNESDLRDMMRVSHKTCQVWKA